MYGLSFHNDKAYFPDGASLSPLLLSCADAELFSSITVQPSKLPKSKSPLLMLILLESLIITSLALLGNT